MKHVTVGIVGLFLFASVSVAAPSEARWVWLDEIDLSVLQTTGGFGPGPGGGMKTPRVNGSVFGRALSIGEETFERGVGTLPTSAMLFDLHGDVKQFTAKVGVDGSARGPEATVEFLVYADGNSVWKSGTMTVQDAPKAVSVDLSGIKELALVVTDADDGGRFEPATWAEAKFQVQGEAPVAKKAAAREPYILTPKPPRTPRINGAKVVGVTPGAPFLFLIPVTGDRPMTFSARNLPQGLALDAASGQITGAVATAGTYVVALGAKNDQGSCQRELKIVVGEAIALTPPLGWNSWNCWSEAVDGEKIKAAAKAMKESGLADHGWTYVNIDDTWQGMRGGEFNAIQGNEKFPDMKGLCDYVHGLGLRVGIYSTPWTVSFAGFMGGSSNNEEGKWEFGDYPQKKRGDPGGPGGPDGQGGPMGPGGPGGPGGQGFDPMQFDKDKDGKLSRSELPERMAERFSSLDTDGDGFLNEAEILAMRERRGPGGQGGGPGGPGGGPGGMFGDRMGKYSFAENDARQWAAWGIDYLKYDWIPNDVPHVTEMSEALKKSGRDIVYSLSNSADFQQAAEWARLSNCWRTTGDIRDTWDSMAGIGFAQARWSPYAGPGHWNDPDMLVVGKVGWGPNLRPSSLTADEQYTHISLWCLLAAPLLIGCDLADWDEFTLSLLTNDEVLAVDQDSLGKQATCIVEQARKQIWVKDMEDGSKAVGLFNLDLPFLKPAPMTTKWSDLGIQGKYRVRDLWRQKDLGVFTDAFTAEVSPHGVALVRLFPE